MLAIVAVPTQPEKEVFAVVVASSRQARVEEHYSNERL